MKHLTPSQYNNEVEKFNEDKDYIPDEDSKFRRFKGNKSCPKCHGEGNYMYDDMHGQICELCCTHPEGWISLDPKFFGKDCIKYNFCKFGCGAKKLKRKSKYCTCKKPVLVKNMAIPYAVCIRCHKSKKV